jgi:cardiolipin synthase
MAQAKVRSSRAWVWQVARMALGGLAALQAVIASVLMITAALRRRRQRRRGFPYATFPATQVGDNTLRIYAHGQELYDAMLAAVDAAEESIYLETYLWKGDAVGREFKEHLARKARQGIEVYAIYDNFGNLVVPRAFKRFPPEMHTLRYQGVRHPWHLLDPRRYALEHRKLLVVDGRVGFLGGYNLGTLYATEWRDTHVHMEGPIAAQLAQEFVSFWNQNRPRSERITRHYPRRFDPLIVLHGNNATRLAFPIRDMYIAAINRAEHRILLTNAYFIPDRHLLQALTEAAERGVEVEVLLPWASNHTLADWMARGNFATCLRAGIRIFGYRGMVHAKTCTIDGQWTTIGTANLDRLSSLGNHELNAEIYSPKLAAQMEYLFERDKGNATEISAEHWIARPWQAKASERLLAPLRFLG